MTEQTSFKQAYPIVGIGASAGGLDALQRFLAMLPQDFGFALVFIQHLSAKHKSLLQELLSARRPSLVIQQISDGLKIQPGRLYLAPPGREVRLQNGLFQTTIHPEGLIHLPIDEFLLSLAENAAEHSIAVIFSGAGTDGARGCQAVRSAGGTVLVQDPQTAEFDSMPLAAIATGHADAVLSPEDIAAELLKVRGIGETAVHREYPIAPEEYGSFFRLLQEKTGSRFNHYKKSVVSRRIKRRMYLHGLPTVKEYLDLVSTSDAEAALLASDLMIGVTSFFRDRVAWKALNLEAVRKIVAENTSVPIRVWTPASATGEEAYSIAMIFLRELELAEKKRDIHVFATDVNDRALERAREGKYPASISADVPHEYVQKYFTSADNGNCLVINKDVRECVVFAKQNLLMDPPFSKLDLIICRNFLIYLEPEAQEKCIKLFHYALNNGGYLFLGNAETVGRKSMLFKTIGHKQCRVYRKLETKPASRLPISVPYAAERKTPSAKQAQATEQARSIMEVIQEKLLEGYGPASVAIDQNYEIIYHNGPTNRYLRQPRGVPTQNLLDLLPDSLRSRIRGALYGSGREERPVSIRTSMGGDDNKKRQVSLKIIKVRENIHIVVFQEKGASSKEEATETADASVIEETAIRQLENELSATRADLQSHIEQLKSMNEEFQSSNEELQAANEELETSREELQSLNEELITVNSQLQGKIEEQDATNNDLNNFQASTNIPTIFLDTHFRVKRFTPAMLRLIKLLPSDVGRPIVDMSQENLGPDLTSDAQAVVETLVPARQELELGGAWYVRTTLPYRTADNRIEGVVITYNDITELKLAEERTRHLASFPQLNPNPICEVHSSGTVTFCNPATEKVLVNLGMGMEDLAAFLPEDMESILRDLEKNEEASLYREKVIRDRVFGMTVHLAPQFDVVRIYSYEITERKKAEELQGRLAAIVESAEDAIIGKELTGIIQTWNVGAEKIFGYKAEEVIGRNISLLVPPEHTDEVPEILERIKQGEHIENFETVRMRKDGTIIPVSLKFSAIKAANGKVIGASKIAHDITARKRAEEELRRSEELFRLAMDNMPDAVAIYDDERRYEFVNAAGLRRVGKSLESLVGRRLDEMYDERTRNAFWPALMRTYETGETQTTETTLTMPTGRYDLILTFVPMLKDGRVSRVLSFTFDITERKRAEEAMRLSEEKFSLAFANNPAAIAMTRLEDGLFLDVNDTWLTLNGYSRDAVIGHSARQLPIWPTAEAAARFVQELREKGILRGWEQEFLKKSGEVFVAQLSAQVLTVRGEQMILSTFVDITERKRAEEALKASEEQFRALADSIPNLAWWANGDGYITWYNRRWYEYTGTTPKQMEGWGWQSVHDPEALPKVLERWKASISTGEPFDMEFPLRGADGVFRTFLTRVFPLKDSADRVFRWFGTNTDISVLKRAEKERERLFAEVQHRAMELDAIFKVLPYLVSVHGQDGRYLRVNQALVDLFGFDPTTATREEIARRVQAHFPDGRPLTRDNMPSSRALNGESVNEVEYVITNEQGEEHVLLVNATPLKLGERIYGAVLSQLDITERKRAEEALRASEVQYRGLFENMVEGCAYCKMVFENEKPQDFIYLSVNHAFEMLTGLKNVVGKRVSEVIPGIREADRELFEIYGRVSLTGKPERFEMFVDALKMWFSISVYSPEKEFFVAVFDVITERKKAEADILKLSEDMSTRNRELESVNKELEFFIYSVSHDLRAPIRTMSGFAKILHEDYVGKLDVTAQDYINRILKGSEKSTQLINDLLHLSSISRQELSRIDVNLSNKASRIVEELREMNRDRNVEVAVQEGLAASVDPRLIELALSNLLGNAWKFTSNTEKAKIEFGAFECGMRNAEFGMKMHEHCKQGTTVYFIRDNGAGFDMKYADKMFWPFHRLHADKEFEGTGIGLTIVERVIHRHGGKVWAEGEVGKGATFFFTLG